MWIYFLSFIPWQPNQLLPPSVHCPCWFPVQPVSQQLVHVVWPLFLHVFFLWMCFFNFNNFLSRYIFFCRNIFFQHTHYTKPIFEKKIKITQKIKNHQKPKINIPASFLTGHGTSPAAHLNWVSLSGLLSGAQ